MNNETIGRGATTALSQLQWSQCLTRDNEKQQRRRTDTLRETLHDGQIVFQDRGFSGS